jgi:branched-chain amino acid transport system permease protein
MLSYLYEVLTLVAVFATASLGLALIVGQAGLLSLYHGAFVGLGAYTYALLATAGVNPFGALVAAILLCAVVAVLLGYFISNLEEEQFAVVTLAFQVLFVNILTNWAGLTHGSYGISQIPRLSVGGFGESRITFLFTCLMMASLTFIAVRAIVRSGFGTLLRASGADKDVVEGLGASVLRLRIRALAIGSAIAGLAGALFAMHAGYIAPQLFELHLSILILAMVIVGGTGSPVAGAALLVVLPEVLRFAAFSPASAGPLRQVVFGSLLLVVIFAHAVRRKRMRDSSA